MLVLYPSWLVNIISFCIFQTAEEIINQNNCCSQMKIVEDSRLRERVRIEY